MSNEQAIKTCRMCYQQIDKRARRCPYCGTAQSLWAHPLIGFIPAAALMAAVMIALGMMIRLTVVGVFGRGEPFAGHRGELEVVESDRFFGKDSRGIETVTGVGIIRNNGSIPWRDVSVEVRFLDSQGRLLDTAMDYGFNRTVMPNDDSAFKASASLRKPQEEYASHKVFVCGAVDARSNWP